MTQISTVAQTGETLATGIQTAPTARLSVSGARIAAQPVALRRIVALTPAWITSPR